VSGVHFKMRGWTPLCSSKICAARAIPKRRALALTARIGRTRAAAQSGFTLFELIVVVCLVAIMAGVLLNRLQVYREAAEKVAMQQTAAAIKSALQMRVAAYLIAGRDNDIESLRNENPVHWLQEPPQGYAGEFRGDAYARVPRGSWYFDLTRKEMIYVIDRGDSFKPGDDRRKWVRFQVRIEYDTVPVKDGPPRKVMSAATFASTQPYVWY